jgi:hypothetical protein
MFSLEEGANCALNLAGALKPARSRHAILNCLYLFAG